MTYQEIMRARIDQYILEGRTVSGGKGDSTLKAGENSQSSFNSTLQNAFSTQFANQSGVLSQLKSAVTGQMQQGFGAPQLAAMSTGNIQNAATAVKNAQVATNNSLATKGGNTVLPSGVSAQLTAQNDVAGQALEDQGANQIALENAQQQQKNFWTGASDLEGVAQAYNPDGVASDANSGSSALSGLGQAYNASNQSQLLGALGGVVGGVGGALVSKGSWLGPKSNP